MCGFLLLVFGRGAAHAHSGPEKYRRAQAHDDAAEDWNHTFVYINPLVARDQNLGRAWREIVALRQTRYHCSVNQKRTIAGVVGTVALVLTSSVGQAQKSPLAQAAYARAQVHLAASQFAEAAMEMQTAVRYEPRFALGWYVLASAERRAQRCDEAVFAYRRYMELRPAEPDPYFGAGLCLHAIGDVEVALVTLRHYLDTEKRPSSNEFVAIARQHVSELERARAAALIKAEAAKSSTPAAGAGTSGASSAPAQSSALSEARVSREHGRAEEAIARYRSAMAANSKVGDSSGDKSAEASAELGGLLVSMRRPGEAVEVLRTAVRLDRTSTPAWYNLAFALRESGHPADAVGAYWRYITFRPHDPDPHYGLGRALASLGRDQEALAAFRTYVSLEKRPTEGKWVKKARLEITRIESRMTTATATTTATAATMTTPPAAISTGGSAAPVQAAATGQSRDKQK